MIAAVSRWWFEPQPRARVAALRTVAYVFVFVDVLFTTAWVAEHRFVPTAFYRPLLIGRLLPLPEPTTLLVDGVKVALLVACAVAATNRLPRLAGGLAAALYLEWMVIAMSYGKVDHDRFSFLVLLAVLPTVGRARFSDRTSDEAAGWALRCVQVAVVATYFLAAVTKLRYSGPEWLTSTTFLTAVIRRGSMFGDWFAQFPWLLQSAQWGIVGFELVSPIMLGRGWWRRAGIVGAIGLHAVTVLAIKIIFLPHLVALLSFAPLERIGWRVTGAGDGGGDDGDDGASVTAEEAAPATARDGAARAPSATTRTV